MRSHAKGFVSPDRRVRAATAMGLSAAFLAPSLGAATISGRLTECCGGPAPPRLIVAAYEELLIGFPGPGGRCGFPESSKKAVGSGLTRADGSYSVTYVPTERLPQHCFFEARMFIEVSTPEGETAVVVSPKVVRLESEDLVFEDLDLGLGPNCPEPRITFSFEGPSVVSGQPGETVPFEVFALLTAECLGTQAVLNVDAWAALVTADGGRIIAATTSGTVAARADADPPGHATACVFDLTRLEAQSPRPDGASAQCPIQAVALSYLELRACPGGTGYQSLPLVQGFPNRILRLTLEAVIPPAGVESSCKVYFRDGCPTNLSPFPDFNKYLTGGDITLPELVDLQVELWVQTTTAAVFRRADSNASGTVDISDAIGTFNYLFIGDEPPSCMNAADSNADGVVDISDGVNTLGYLFGGTSEIPAPGPDACGASAEERAIGCELYGSCD